MNQPASRAVDHSSGYSREQIRRYGQLSPFELKNVFIDLAQHKQEDEPGQKGTSQTQMLNAGRGNPNWIATGPREAFHALGYFALEESKRVWTADHLGGMPEARGAGGRFDSFLRRHPELPGTELLERCVEEARRRFGLDKDTLVHELADGITGDNYPVPDRILPCAEQIIRGYLGEEMYGGTLPEGNVSLFATEGGTAAMCYIFDSLLKNDVVKKGDRIALMVPVFTPYIEIPALDTFDFDVVLVRASMFAEEGVREWRYPEEEVAKLADPSIRLVCLVNPSNPPSLALSERVRNQLKDIVAGPNPDLVVVTDDVYGTFVEGFTSLAADLPHNTLLVYSYSKHYGATGWRLGVIALHDDNVIDRRIAALPEEAKDRLAKRYGTLTLEPGKMRFIDRMVADSRDVALNHTAGLSTPQQVLMTLFSLFDLLDEGQAYKHRIRGIVADRLRLLLEGAEMKIAEDPLRAGYYIELDLLAEAERTRGPEFARYLQDTYEPIDPLFRLAEQTGVVLLNGGGFDGPEWSVRVSLANLDDLDYLRIGHYVRAVFDEYGEEWRRATSG
ncbi:MULTISPECIES: bifunctional aspartate transaminase/aspartate 4-decarboxylase [unclassified Streptomyces]|uniref:Aminotransferase n=1 Tax=Streptomyces evansiae TaxID=3075535 RepID=A0ABU2R176_9ACTN|nr:MULTISPECIES: bifunctional aspartate transaminase/aspartate 4-decarboxylase [unclassified Streptomyces]EFL00041.1 aspartate aminotransferase [Streptomyces sp. SPB78]MDT0410380.1 bifunctional aspartate transaminase/aspartate 4-decarboxylase [Streptomyces sp. DSM 41979]MYQ57068.1 bifunctional aspartate transaminase/aspartate 4-decarboxylase [Streptomyces sp. SID4926]NJA55065.1 bifunctional aspartate transaminase/aspartate 4-decarboxylase [Streptomyces sp. NEAU-H3]SCE18306.1 aspartate 4-decarb